MPGKHRIIVAKPGLDGHDRGVKVIARSLRDAGFEVIYTGLHQTPEQIAETTIQEGCRRGRSVLPLRSAHDAVPEGGQAPARQGRGGCVGVRRRHHPRDDIPKLEEAGIERIFTPGASTTEIVDWLNERLSDHRAS
jgi:methylmalonyl-CoA mutase C-terminal domain/subunit